MSHPNDMSAWADIHCQRGCVIHPLRSVDVVIGGPTPYADLTPIPNRFETEFSMVVWDTSETPVDGGPYCPARDAVSETILALGVWEPQETTVLALCVEQVGRKVRFIDIGAQIGWHSTVMAARSIPVLAIEADPDVAKLCALNLDGRGRIEVRTLRVDEHSEPLHFDGQECAVVKIDIEGAEHHAVTMLLPGIQKRLVPFILMEMSPVFNDTYPDIAQYLLSAGYQMYCLPPKQRPPVKLDSLADLKPFKIRGGVEEVRAEVASWDQRDVLFALGGIT